MKDSLKRLLDWIESHGGPQEVAPRIGKNPQSFYNYRNRGSMPNMEILEKLATEFEDFDPTYILTGKAHHDPFAVTPAIEAELEELRKKNEWLQGMYFEVAKREAKRELLGKRKDEANTLKGLRIERKDRQNYEVRYERSVGSTLSFRPRAH